MVSIALLSVFLTACGGGDDADTAAVGNTGSGQKDLGRLKVAHSEQYDLPQIGTDAGLELGTFTERNLTVEMAVSENLGQALATKDADIVVGSPNRLIGAMRKGLDAKIIGPTIPWWDQYIIVSSKLPAQKPEDLKGKKFGISSFGSAGHYSTTKLAASLGWRESDFQIVTLGNLKGLLAGLQNGTIDAFPWSAGAAFTTELKGYGRVIGSVRDLVGPSPLDVIAVRADVLKDRPEAVKAYCDGYYDAVKRLQADPKKTQELFVSKWGADAQVMPKVIEAELGLLSTSADMSDEIIRGMTDATRFTVEGAKDITEDEVKEFVLSCNDI